MKKSFYLLLFVVLIAFLIYFYLNFSKTHKIEALSKGINISSISYKSKNYKIVDGKVSPKDLNYDAVLRLALFYQWNKEDPLFYSPDFNFEAFKDTVSALEFEQANLLKLLSQESKIYPSDFFRSLISSSEKMELFLNQPSEILANQLIDSQNKAQKDYDMDINGLISSSKDLEAAKPTSLNVQTSTSLIFSDFQKIAENSQSLKSEIDKRRKCLTEQRQCLRPMLSFNKPKPAQLDNKPDNLLSATVIFRIGKNSAKHYRGPYGVLSPCLGYGENFSWPRQYYYLTDDPKLLNVFYNLPTENIQLASELFFRQIQLEANQPGDEQLKQQGGDYIHQPATASYMCSYQGYFTEIAELDDFLLNRKPMLKDKAISNLLRDNKNILERASFYEDRFFKTKYPSYDQLTELANYYGYVYKLISVNQNRLLEDVEQQQKLELLNRYLEINRKLVGFHKLINDFLTHIRTASYREILRPQAQIEFSKTYNYFFNSAYSLMFMPFTKSVWRLDSNPQYLEKIIIKGAVGFGGGYITLKQALEKYSAGEIKKWYGNTTKILGDLAKKELDLNK